MSTHGRGHDMIAYLRGLSPRMLQVLYEWAEDMHPYHLLILQTHLAAIASRVAFAVALHSLD